MSICHAFLFFGTYSISDVACFILESPFFYIRHARGRRLCQNLKGYKPGLCKRSKCQEIINQLHFSQILLQHRETQLPLIISRFQWPKNQYAPVQQKNVNSILRSVCVSSHHEILQHSYHISTCFLPISILENKVKRQKTSSIGIIFEENILREFSMLQCRCKYLLYITIFLHQHVFC